VESAAVSPVGEGAVDTRQRAPSGVLARLTSARWQACLVAALIRQACDEQVRNAPDPGPE